MANYSKEVLVGNWNERRYTNEVGRNGIIPGIEAQKGCEHHSPLSHDIYNSKPFVSDNVYYNYCDIRQRAYSNFLQSNLTNIHLQDTDEHRDNFTTTNHLLYEVLPKLKLKQCVNMQDKEGAIPQREVEIDLLQSFGNLSKTGYRQLHKDAEKAEKTISYRTTYADAFEYRGDQLKRK